jgi:transcriptional regulator with XRE-family HTH domain
MSNENVFQAPAEVAEPVFVSAPSGATAVHNEIRIGGRLKHARLVKELTLKEVAKAAGCSESLLSKVENGKAYPSLPMLHRIAAALGTNVGALLMAPDEQDSVVSRPEQRTNYVVHGHGIRLERVIPYAAAHLLQSNIHWIAPGASLEGDIAHEGEELGYVLEGEIELTVGGRRYLAGEGAAFHFRSELPHSYRNTSSRPARVIWVSTPPTF